VTYKIVYTQRAVKDIKTLDPKTKKRIGNTLLRYKDNPLQYADKLTDPKTGTYRFRIGDYRIIFDIEGNEIVVLRIGHRREIYKRR
jgi:mRNA interferase RelE/StbE